MEGFAENETLHRMVKVCRPHDEYGTSLLQACNTVLAMFSPETIPEPKNVETVIRSMIQAS